MAGWAGLRELSGGNREEVLRAADGKRGEKGDGDVRDGRRMVMGRRVIRADG